MKRVAALLILLIGIGPAIAQRGITSPEAAFGFKLGADRKLADWNQLTAYYKKLSTESNRIHYEELGKTPKAVHSSRSLSRRQRISRIWTTISTSSEAG